MEYLPYGDLQSYINQTTLSEPEAAVITQQVGRALQHMHSRHFVHRDLKPLVSFR